MLVLWVCDLCYPWCPFFAQTVVNMADIDLNVDSLIQRLLEGTLYFTDCQQNLSGLRSHISFLSFLNPYLAALTVKEFCIGCSVVDDRFISRYIQ